jgi:hypothetical protein
MAPGDKAEMSTAAAPDDKAGMTTAMEDRAATTTVALVSDADRRRTTTGVRKIRVGRGAVLDVRAKTRTAAWTARHPSAPVSLHPPPGAAGESRAWTRAWPLPHTVDGRQKISTRAADGDPLLTSATASRPDTPIPRRPCMTLPAAHLLRRREARSCQQRARSPRRRSRSRLLGGAAHASRASLPVGAVSTRTRQRGPR